MEHKVNKKILFLHGYIQNGHIFETRLKNLTKKIQKKYNNISFSFLFPDAPIILPEQTIPNEVQRGWMQIEKNKQDDFLKMETVNYFQMEKSIEHLYSIGNEHKDIECIFGFSQGAELLVFLIILSLYKEGEFDIKKHFPNLKCLVFVAGFCRPFPQNEMFKDILMKLLEPNDKCLKCDIPSLHVYGLADMFIDANHSKEALKFFSNYEEFAHNGKHFVPSTKSDVERFEMFLEKYLDLH